ncbi:MAG TPA: hypothetical protein VKU19_25460 [Bryobacteraceae bacterium]|nr:hypothetical protein [Bryobacteraceae bacterium]
MPSPSTLAPPDLLAQFLACVDPQEAEILLDHLISGLAAPLVGRIVYARIPAAAAVDVQHDVLVDLIHRLRDLRQSGTRAIRDFQAYVAVAAYHGCNEYFRQCFPQRYRLRTRLQYLLECHPRLTLWHDSHGELVCGPKEDESRASTQPLQSEKAGWAASRELSKLIERILAESDQPMPFDDLLDRAAELLGVSDQPEESSEALIHPAASVETQLAQRGWLAQLWSEINSLPKPQRTALLLSMRDDGGGSALLLLPITGVASLRQIADATGMAPEKLAGIWNRLPLDDRQIGELLGLERQKVTNLRKSARERLRRRQT